MTATVIFVCSLASIQLPPPTKNAGSRHFNICLTFQTHRRCPSFIYSLLCIHSEQQEISRFSISSSLLSHCEVAHTVEVTEQSHVTFIRVDNQIGKCLLLLSHPRETSARLVLQTIKLCG